MNYFFGRGRDRNVVIHPLPLRAERKRVSDLVLTKNPSCSIIPQDAVSASCDLGRIKKVMKKILIK